MVNPRSVGAQIVSLAIFGLLNCMKNGSKLKLSILPSDGLNIGVEIDGLMRFGLVPVSKTDGFYAMEIVGCISSPPFSVGGYNWALDFYPHGVDDSDSDQESNGSHDFYMHRDDSDQENDGSHTSLYLWLLSRTKDIYVESSFDILVNKGKLVPFDEPTSDTFTSSGDFDSWGYPEILSAPSGVDDSSGGLYEDIEKIWQKGEKFDVTFEVEGERISAHRFMLAARSPVFEAELHGPFVESNSTCVIKIHDMKAEVFKALLRFIYTDDFEFLSVELVQDVFIAADRYDLPMLKSQCQQWLVLNLSIETVLQTLILAEQHSSPWLKEKCLEFTSKLENFTQLALTEGYVHMMQSFPSLLVELRKKVNISSDVVTMLKKQMTS
ncbi:BTB/POZ and MATH domain-containing protein 2-like [Carex rostrata]